MDAKGDRWREVLRAMARGDDVWRDFLDLLGPFILHVLKNDYGFYQEYDEHARQEILHDIYLRVARYAGTMSACPSLAGCRAYLRRIIKSVMCNRWRIVDGLDRVLSPGKARGSAQENDLDVLPDRHMLDPLKLLVELWRSRALRSAVREAIRRVARRSQDPERTAYILVQRLLNEKSYGELAAKTSMEIDAIRQTLRYYRKAVIDEAKSLLGLGPD